MMVARRLVALALRKLLSILPLPTALFEITVFSVYHLIGRRSVFASAQGHLCSPLRVHAIIQPLSMNSITTCS